MDPLDPSFDTVAMMFTNKMHGWSTTKMSLERTDKADLSICPVYPHIAPIPQVASSLATARKAATLALGDFTAMAATAAVAGEAACLTKLVVEV